MGVSEEATQPNHVMLRAPNTCLQDPLSAKALRLSLSVSASRVGSAGLSGVVADGSA